MENHNSKNNEAEKGGSLLLVFSNRAGNPNPRTNEAEKGGSLF